MYRSPNTFLLSCGFPRAEGQEFCSPGSEEGLYRALKIGSSLGRQGPCPASPGVQALWHSCQERSATSPGSPALSNGQYKDRRASAGAHSQSNITLARLVVWAEAALVLRESTSLGAVPTSPSARSLPELLLTEYPAERPGILHHLSLNPALVLWLQATALFIKGTLLSSF